ncbi:MAG TPA: cyclase family protein [Crocinitomicaceae bacterium]|nr:cyclase family protein [Crocinitomicaceae bacterium]
MKLHIDNNNFIDTSRPLDISIPLRNSEENPKAWYVSAPRFEAVMTDQFTGSVKKGGSVNFRNVFFNPHGHGTHTECLGHITEEVFSINETLSEYFFQAQLISISPKELVREDGEVDLVVLPEQFPTINPDVEALIIRTTPNKITKKSMDYSATNPPYLDVRCVQVLLDAGIKHLLIDLPSVDRENDNGELAFHHAFWEVPKNPNFERTITELIFVSDEIIDSNYVLNIQTAPFENDATPSRPVLYKIKKS